MWTSASREKAVSYEISVGPVVRLERGRIEDHKAQSSTWTSFQWTVKNRERVTQLQAWLICCVQGGCFHSWLGSIYPETPHTHKHARMLGPANTCMNKCWCTDTQTKNAFSYMHNDASEILITYIKKNPGLWSTPLSQSDVFSSHWIRVFPDLTSTLPLLSTLQ